MNKFEESKFLQEEIKHKRAELVELERKSKELGNYYIILSNGLIGEQPINSLHWTSNVDCYIQGNLFDSKEEAELEVQRRNLFFRFKHFRNECNEDWKPDWSDNKEIKAYIQYHEQFNKFVIKYTLNRNILQTFGFFKCKQDAERAIELFGDEIKKLFIDCECD